ncbi:hypothetical protein ACOMHN_054113 [Nucella lapillus]
MAFLLMSGIESNPGPDHIARCTSEEKSVNTGDQHCRGMQSEKHCRSMQTSPSSVAEGRLGNVPLTGINREDRLSAAVEDLATAIKALQTSQQSLSSRIEKRLGDMENKLMCRIDHLSDKCDILQCDVDAMQDICDSVKEENEQLHNRVHTLEGQLDVVENQNRKSNLLFFGIPTTASEVWSDSEKKACDFIKNDMGISDLVVEYAHRVGKAIMVIFQSIKAKEQVLIQARRLKHSSVYVREDFSPAVRKKRNALQPLLRSLRDDGKRAYLRFDRVVCEGTSYTFDVGTASIQQQSKPIQARGGQRSGDSFQLPDGGSNRSGHRAECSTDEGSGRQGYRARGMGRGRVQPSSQWE